jgi:hypothetical protein
VEEQVKEREGKREKRRKQRRANEKKRQAPGSRVRADSSELMPVEKAQVAVVEN